MTIDTSTTAGKIAVMQAFERGEKCEWKYDSDAEKAWAEVVVPSWNWVECVYRIKPRGPREFFLCVPKDGSGVGYVAEPHSIYNSAVYESIKVREVLE